MRGNNMIGVINQRNRSVIDRRNGRDSRLWLTLKVWSGQKGVRWLRHRGYSVYAGRSFRTRDRILMKKIANMRGAALQKPKVKENSTSQMKKKVSVLKLENDSIFINGNDLLAFETSLKWDIKLLRRVAGMMAGGLFNIKLEGTGMVAITTHQDPLTLRVSAGHPVFTDLNATIAWSGNLEPEIKTDISLKTLVGRSSGESVQMAFKGEGFVIVQPYEEVYFQAQA